jgi:hypothetical protein
MRGGHEWTHAESSKQQDWKTGHLDLRGANVANTLKPNQGDPCPDYG